MDKIRAMKNKILPSEHQIQSSFFQLLRLKYKSIAPYCWATPNGGFRHWSTACKLKREGVMAGVFDVFVAWPINGKHGLFIEFKTGKNSLTDAQKVFMRKMVTNDYSCCVCYSVDEAFHYLRCYLEGIILQPGGIK